MKSRSEEEKKTNKFVEYLRNSSQQHLATKIREMIMNHNVVFQENEEISFVAPTKINTEVYLKKVPEYDLVL